jgi:uncharacterized protein
MSLLVKTLAWLAVGYVLLLAVLYFGQRRFMYLPDRTRVAPAATGLKGVSEVMLVAHDGVQLVTWWSPPPHPQAPVILYFHGNAAGLADRAPRIGAYQAAGYGVLMLAYRSYAGSGGAPNATDNVADALAAHDALVQRGIDPARIVAYGESLGTHMATRVALQRRVGALVLDAPYTSVVDVAAQRFFFLPVRPFVHDRYETAAIIGGLKVPLLVLHGARDQVIPVAMGRKIAELAPEPKRYVEFAGGQHSDLYNHGAMVVIQTFLVNQGVAQPAQR